LLPDFPKHKKLFHKIFNKVLNHFIWEGSFLNDSRKDPHYEGNKYLFADIQLNADDPLHDEAQKYNEISGQFEIKRSDIIEKGYEAYIEAVPEIAEMMRNQYERDVIDKMSTAADKAGNIVKVQDREETLEDFLESLPVTFSRNGEIQKPSILIHPDNWPSLQKKMLSWEGPKSQEIHDRVMEKKRQKWNEQQSYRKLVD